MYCMLAIHSRTDIHWRAPGIVDRFPRDHPYVALTAKPAGKWLPNGGEWPSEKYNDRPSEEILGSQ